MKNENENITFKDAYITPEFEIVAFDYKDIISASAGPCTSDICGGDDTCLGNVNCPPHEGCAWEVCPPNGT